MYGKAGSRAPIVSERYSDESNHRGYIQICCCIFSARAVILTIASVETGDGERPGNESWRAVSAVNIELDDFRTVIRN